MQPTPERRCVKKQVPIKRAPLERRRVRAQRPSPIRVLHPTPHPPHTQPHTHPTPSPNPAHTHPTPTPHPPHTQPHTHPTPIPHPPHTHPPPTPHPPHTHPTPTPQVVTTEEGAAQCYALGTLRDGTPCELFWSGDLRWGTRDGAGVCVDGECTPARVDECDSPPPSPPAAPPSPPLPPTPPGIPPQPPASPDFSRAPAPALIRPPGPPPNPYPPGMKPPSAPNIDLVVVVSKQGHPARRGRIWSHQITEWMETDLDVGLPGSEDGKVETSPPIAPPLSP